MKPVIVVEGFNYYIVDFEEDPDMTMSCSPGVTQKRNSQHI